MVIVKENLQVPAEGIFWVIDNELIALCDDVNPKDPYDSTDLLHKESWKTIRSKYLVNGKEVDYNYFPRGRVETLVILNSDGTLDHYESSIYLDKCILKKAVIDKIVEEFKLYLKNVNFTVEGQLFIDGSHYTCHNCRK